ncbi:MAG: hypothetical protein M3Z04_13395, partial [Chloroflexota bacterium]|nr:hypothetical protein [Chloroflexota bacterium]
LLIGAALVALAVFVGIGFSALLNSGGVTPTPTAVSNAALPSAAVNSEATRLAGQAAGLAATLTAVSNVPATAVVAQVPPSATPVAVAATQPPAATAPPTAATVAVSTAAATFVIPTSAPTAQPGVVAVQPILKDGQPDVGAEIQAYFARFYQARTLLPGGSFDLSTVTNLTEQPYRDYTLGLLRKSVADVQAGTLREVSYHDIAVRVVVAPDLHAAPPTAEVEVIRTQDQVRTDKSVPSVTDKLRFRLHRRELPNGMISWTAYDYFNGEVNAWLTDSSQSPTTLANDQVQRELNDFFNRFYQARTLGPGTDGDVVLEKTGELTDFAYRDYTVPLLQQQVDELTGGKLRSLQYSDIKVQLDQWDARATNHGGLATVHVTRTSHVQRAGQAEVVQTGTYQFRLHRHMDDAGGVFWIAVDFLSPISHKWVSESAGMTGPVPAAGQG